MSQLGGDDIGGIVARGEQQRLQRLPQSHLIADIQTGAEADAVTVTAPALEG
jgi:hypothetical protein